MTLFCIKLRRNVAKAFRRFLRSVGLALHSDMRIEKQGRLIESNKRGWAERKADTAIKELQAIRAFHAMLYVYQHKHQARAGFAVTMFIPNDTLGRLRAGSPQLVQEYKQRILAGLLERAFKGIWHISEGMAAPTAIMFSQHPGGPVKQIPVWEDGRLLKY